MGTPNIWSIFWECGAQQESLAAQTPPWAVGLVTFPGCCSVPVFPLSLFSRGIVILLGATAWLFQLAGLGALGIPVENSTGTGWEIYWCSNSQG